MFLTAKLKVGKPLSETRKLTGWLSSLAIKSREEFEEFESFTESFRFELLGVESNFSEVHKFSTEEIKFFKVPPPQLLKISNLEPLPEGDALLVKRIGSPRAIAPGDRVEKREALERE